MIRLHDTIEAMAQAAETTAYGPVYRHRWPAPPTTPQWHRTVVRQLQGLEMRETATGVVSAPVQVAVEVAGYADPDLLLEAAHEAIETALSALKTDTSHGRMLLEVRRYSRPTAPVYDADNRSYTSAATYLVVLF